MGFWSHWVKATKKSQNFGLTHISGSLTWYYDNRCMQSRRFEHLVDLEYYLLDAMIAVIMINLLIWDENSAHSCSHMIDFVDK